MSYDLILLGLLLAAGARVVNGQAEYLPKKIYAAFPVDVAPDIEGKLDDKAWQLGSWGGGFTQFEPYADRPPSHQTEFKIAFDDTYLYVAIKAIDSSPDSIKNRMSRRDNEDGDLVYIILDSYHDLRTGFTFGVSSAGVRFDQIISSNGEIEDPNWDPIWQAKTHIYDWGWAAEMKIPFTQLRFKRNSGEVWGLEVARQIFRKDELSYWHPIPRNAPGIIHAIGELDGLQEVEPRKQFDLTPYGVGSVKTYEPETGNPYADGTDLNYNIGLDGKIGITNNLTLDFTINPDFGQVEADPSEVNLTAFETFFEEKRPFFIEGKNITSFNVGLGEGDVGNDNLFYSRRIGRRPQGYPELANNEYARVPAFTRILGATKLTGKTANGLSLGIVEAVTADTKARIDDNGTVRKETVEPLTNYSLARMQRDFNMGNTIFGAAITNTTRKLDGFTKDFLHRNATAAGLDFTQYIKERYYSFDVSLYLSNVTGTEEAISNTQTSSARYFQRPDAGYLEYDSTLTSLSGMGGKLQFGRIGGNWNFLLMNVFKSPGLEFNDMGYMRQADNVLSVFWTGYHFTEPFSIFRSLELNNNINMVNDFGGQLNAMGYVYDVWAKFTNFWSAGLGGDVNFLQLSNRILRGGPSMYMPNGGKIYFWCATNDHKAIWVEYTGHYSWGAEEYLSSWQYRLRLRYRPMSALIFSLSSTYTASFHELQYISQADMKGHARYLFGRTDQKILNTSLRIDYSITPDLTIQYWGQPFIASGDYTSFKMITDPKADKFSDRYHVYTDQQINLTNDYYEIDEDGDQVVDYGFDNPDFTVNEWLSNLVIRWEFLPGSTAYLVWSQTRDYSLLVGDFKLWDNMNGLFTDKKASNIFLLKFSYRFGLR